MPAFMPGCQMYTQYHIHTQSFIYHIYIIIYIHNHMYIYIMYKVHRKQRDSKCLTPGNIWLQVKFLDQLGTTESDNSEYPTLEKWGNYTTSIPSILAHLFHYRTWLPQKNPPAQHHFAVSCTLSSSLLTSRVNNLVHCLSARCRTLGFVENMPNLPNS